MHEQKLAVTNAGASSGRQPLERKPSSKEDSLNQRQSSDDKEDEDEYVDDFE